MILPYPPPQGRSTVAMTALQHDIAVHSKTVIPKSPFKGPQLFYVLSTQPSAIHNQHSFNFETMESFAKAEKKRLGLLNSLSGECPHVLRTRKPSQANVSGEVGSSSDNGTDFWLLAPHTMLERKLSQSNPRPRRHGGGSVALFRGLPGVLPASLSVVVRCDRTSSLYEWIRFVPISRHDSPCYTSPSLLVWAIVFEIALIYSQVLADVSFTGPPASLNSPVTGSDHASLPEFLSSLLPPASLSPSHPWLSPAPYLGAVVEGEGSVKAASQKEKNALPSAIQENIIAAPDFPPLTIAAASY
ncbi:hypothetical protein H4582DRAFT_2214377 [Lactarius indigo]|nr:hypothetical protein H4582DRAFT_2214377 [Lactarius indigo]